MVFLSYLITIAVMFALSVSGMNYLIVQIKHTYSIITIINILLFKINKEYTGETVCVWGNSLNTAINGEYVQLNQKFGGFYFYYNNKGKRKEQCRSKKFYILYLFFDEGGWVHLVVLVF